MVDKWLASDKSFIGRPKKKLRKKNIDPYKFEGHASNATVQQ